MTPLTVGVGVMAYYGTNDDRRQADEIHASYLEKMKLFVRWLADSGHRIRLFGGRQPVGRPAWLRRSSPTCGHTGPISEPMWAVAEPVTSLAELMRQMAPVGTVVAIRYHNVLCALKLSQAHPVDQLRQKHDLLMADMGLSEFCQFANTFDVDRLIEQFTDLQGRSDQLSQAMAERNAEKAQLLDHQFAELSALLFPGSEVARTAAGSQAAREAIR